MAENQNLFDKKAEALAKFVSELPNLNREVAIEAINFFKESFDNQGFTDKTLIPWRKTKSGKRSTFGKQSQGILIKSGELKDSFDYAISGTIITVSNSAPHAKTHNEGLTINHPGGTAFYKDKKGYIHWVTNREAKNLSLKRTKPHKIPMPMRKFMGKSAMLNKRIAQLIVRKLIKIL